MKVIPDDTDTMIRPFGAHAFRRQSRSRIAFSCWVSVGLLSCRSRGAVDEFIRRHPQQLSTSTKHVLFVFVLSFS